VANGNGAAGNPVFSIDPDPILPGSAGVTLPSGVTSLRGGGAGTLRFNTSINLFEGTPDGSTWNQFLTNSSSLSLIGDVSGSGALGTPITTTLNQTIIRPSGMEWQFNGNNSFTSHLLTLTNPVATYVSQWFLQKAVLPWTGYIHRYTRTPVGSGNFALTRWNNGVETSQISFSETDDYATIHNGLHMNLAPVDNVGTFSIGRTKGTVGASRIENYGQAGSVLGPHYQTVTSEDNYPNFQHLAWTHNNISLNFDSYYDGTSFKSSYIPSNFQIYKIGNRLNFNYALGFNLGSNITFATALSIGADGNIGINTTNANGNLQFPSINKNRKIVLWEGTNNDHQYQGFGTNASILRFQVPDTSNDFVFYAGTSSTTGAAGGANTGNGGGGSNFSNAAGAGGSGLVIIRYLGAQKATGGTVTSSGGYTIHTFTTSGTFTA